jgi:hypothetical protein
MLIFIYFYSILIEGGRPFSHPSLHSDGALDDIDEDIEFDDPLHRPLTQEELREVNDTNPNNIHLDTDFSFSKSKN